MHRCSPIPVLSFSRSGFAAPAPPALGVPTPPAPRPLPIASSAPPALRSRPSLCSFPFAVLPFPPAFRIGHVVRTSGTRGLLNGASPPRFHRTPCAFCIPRRAPPIRLARSTRNAATEMNGTPTGREAGGEEAGTTAAGRQRVGAAKRDEAPENTVVARTGAKKKVKNGNASAGVESTNASERARSKEKSTDGETCEKSVDDDDSCHLRLPFAVPRGLSAAIVLF